VLAQGGAEEVADEYLKRAKARGNERLSAFDRGASSYPRWGTGEIETGAVEMLDGSGARALVFQPGEPFRVRVAYRVQRRVVNPVFGLGLYRSDGTYVNGSNHAWRERPIQVGEAVPGETGTAEMSFDAMPLLSGAYYLTVFVYDHGKPAPTAIDHREHVLAFEVVDARRLQHGLLHLASRWEIVRDVPGRGTQRMESAS
jgi:hypothetical protein